jgi:prolyl-tRNA editing enzyme YbaK/EbsC (Cys-tRNA(Pro) deacylase)
MAQQELYVGGGEINALIHLTTAELQRATQAPIIPLI